MSVSASLITRKIFPSPTDLHHALCVEVKRLIRDHRGQKPFSIALAGGSTPKGFYQRLLRPEFFSQIPWESVAFYFGDERPVPPDDPNSNYRMAYDALLFKLPSPHIVRMEAEREDLEEAAAAYEARLREELALHPTGEPIFDLVLLGIGTDGHTASLFPETAALKEETRMVVANEVPQLQTRRMTLTYPILNAARRVWVLAEGLGKRQIVASCLHSENIQGDALLWPVLGVSPHSQDLIWWLDRDASALLRYPRD